MGGFISYLVPEISVFKKLQHDATTTTTVTVKIVIWSGFMCSIFFSKELSVYKVSFNITWVTVDFRNFLFILTSEPGHVTNFTSFKIFYVYFNTWAWSCHKFYFFCQSFTKNLRIVRKFFMPFTFLWMLIQCMFGTRKDVKNGQLLLNFYVKIENFSCTLHFLLK